MRLDYFCASKRAASRWGTRVPIPCLDFRVGKRFSKIRGRIAGYGKLADMLVVTISGLGKDIRIL